METIILTPEVRKQLQEDMYKILPQILIETPSWQRVRRHLRKMERDGASAEAVDNHRREMAAKLIKLFLGQED